ncbi:unnamed protein product, partial [Gulo gulo]
LTQGSCSSGGRPEPCARPESVRPLTGRPILRGSALAPTEAGDPTGSELGWMLQACKMEGFPLVPPQPSEDLVSYDTDLYQRQTHE